jgi:DNA invertase Pin-like site-specific DNA recombinase
MNAVIYARYSSHAQREESIEGQLRVCRDYAGHAGFDVIKEYIDRALTATNDQRPAFQQMIAESASQGFDTVLVYALDRFARDRYDAAVYRKRLKDNGVRIISVTQPIDDSPEGVLIESLLEGLAEYYSKNLARGVMRGMRENALNCKAVGGIVPTGYKIDRTTMKYVIDEEKAGIIREIFEMYADGASIVEICRICNSKGYRTNRGRPFTRNSMSTILKNRKYIGVYKFDDIEIEGGMPAIVDKETFEKAQERISMGNRSRPRKNEDVSFLLSGKLFCGHCGKPMVGTSGTGKGGQTYYYYSCRQHGNKCLKTAERKEKLERFVIGYITETFLTDENISTMADLVMQELDNDEWSQAIKGLERQIADVDSRIKNLMKALELDGDLQPVMDRITELREERKALDQDLSRMKVENMCFLTKDMVEFWMHDVASKNDGSPEYYRSLIETFVNAIYVYDTGEPGEDPRSKDKKRRIVIAFNTSGPEQTVSLECSDKCLTGPPTQHCPNTDAYLVYGGRVILVVLDYF